MSALMLRGTEAFHVVALDRNTCLKETVQAPRARQVYPPPINIRRAHHVEALGHGHVTMPRTSFQLSPAAHEKSGMTGQTSSPSK